MNKTSLMLFAGLLIIFLHLIDNPVAQLPQGDKKLIITKDPTSYQPRDTTNQLSRRFEGLYLTDVSSNIGLEVVSLTFGRLQCPWNAKTALKIFTPDLALNAKKSIEIRAVSIPPKINYRMDAICQPNDSIIWPIEHAFKAGLSSDQIGVFGLIEEGNKTTYVPVWIKCASGSSIAGGDTLILTIRSNVFAKNMKYSIYGVLEQRALESKPVEKRLISPGMPIEIVIPDSLPPHLIITIRAEEFRRSKSLPVLTVEMTRP